MKVKTIATAQEFAGHLAARDRYIIERLFENSAGVIVFGSRAAEVHSKTSDLDILCVDASERVKSARLDIVSRKSSEVEHKKWLGSELAGHVAAFGVVIHGRADWIGAVSLSEEAVSRKQRRVVSLVDGLWAYWDRLHPEFRRKHLVTIRREIQRMQFLARKKAVPPTPLLDREWNQYGSDEGWVRFVQGLKTNGVGVRDRLLRTTDLIVTPRQ